MGTVLSISFLYFVSACIIWFVVNYTQDYRENDYTFNKALWWPISFVKNFFSTIVFIAKYVGQGFILAIKD